MAIRPTYIYLKAGDAKRVGDQVWNKATKTWNTYNGATTAYTKSEQPMRRPK